MHLPGVHTVSTLAVVILKANALDPGKLNVSQGTRFYQVLAPYFDKV